MLRKSRILLPIALTVLLVGAVYVGLPAPARGNGTSISIAPASVTVSVGQQFTVQIWARGVVGMERFYFDILWDTSKMTYVGYTGNNNGGSCGRSSWSPSPGDQMFNVMSITPRFTGDAYWWSLQFQCLATGTSSLSIINAEWKEDGKDPYSFTTASGATVQQNPQQTTTTTRAVGGVLVPTNTFMALASYLAVIGLVATVAVAVKKRRN